jgi:hypothetical protein
MVVNTPYGPQQTRTAPQIDAVFELYGTETHNVTPESFDPKKIRAASVADATRIRQEVAEAWLQHRLRMGLPPIERIPRLQPPPVSRRDVGAISFPDLPNSIFCALRVGQEIVFRTSSGPDYPTFTTRVHLQDAVSATLQPARMDP